MYSQLLPALAFHLRRLTREHPLYCATLALALILAVTSCIAFVSARTSLMEAKRRHHSLLVATAVAPQIQPASSNSQNLSPFDGVQLLDALQSASDVTAIPLGEVTFALDDNSSLPYLRYKAMLTASGNYSSIRRFVDRVTSAVQDVSLDSVVCRRKDIQDPLVSCDLVFSAFYSRGQGG